MTILRKYRFRMKLHPLYIAAIDEAGGIVVIVRGRRAVGGIAVNEIEAVQEIDVSQMLEEDVLE